MYAIVISHQLGVRDVMLSDVDCAFVRRDGFRLARIVNDLSFDRRG
jgi:hypothetical protein